MDNHQDKFDPDPLGGTSASSADQKLMDEGLTASDIATLNALVAKKAGDDAAKNLKDVLSLTDEKAKLAKAIVAYNKMVDEKAGLDKTGKDNEKCETLPANTNETGSDIEIENLRISFSKLMLSIHESQEDRTLKQIIQKLEEEAHDSDSSSNYGVGSYDPNHKDDRMMDMIDPPTAEDFRRLIYDEYKDETDGNAAQMKTEAEAVDQRTASSERIGECGGKCTGCASACGTSEEAHLGIKRASPSNEDEDEKVKICYDEVEYGADDEQEEGKVREPKPHPLQKKRKVIPQEVKHVAKDKIDW